MAAHARLATGVMLFAGLGCAVASGVLMLAVLVALGARGATDGAADPRRWPGAALRVMEGEARKLEDQLELLALSGNHRAVLSSGRTWLAAERYGYLQWTARGLRPGTEAVFYWRTARDELHTRPLPWSGDGRRTVRLQGEKRWRGAVVELGVALRGRLARSVLLEEIRLRPASTALFLASLVDEWLAFDGWSQRSAHYLVLGSAGAAVPLVPLVAGWVLLATALYAGLMALRRDLRSALVPLSFFLAGWLVLDARWSLEQLRQAEATCRGYAGKSAEQRRRAELDGPLYAFLATLKGRLPGRPRRVYFISDKRGPEQEYERERARYHLLPHNVFAYAEARSALEHLRPGEYVVAMGPQRSGANRFLRSWALQRGFELELVYAGHEGSLWRRSSAQVMRPPRPAEGVSRSPQGGGEAVSN